MAFKKLDSSAVSSADSRALDAFVLQGEDANLRQAYADRGRAVAHTFASDSRPVLASPWRSAVPLSPFPVSRGCSQISVQVRGLATVATGETDAINMNLAAQRVDGSVLDTGPSVTVAGGASPTTVDLTIDARQFAGETVILWLAFSSQEQTSTPPTGTQAGSDITRFGTVIELDAVSFTFSASKRYRLSFDQDAAGAESPNTFGYCAPRMIQSQRTTNTYRVIPSIPEWMESYSAFQVNVDEIGFLELYGWSITETAFDDLPSIQLAPGGRLRARQCQELYRRGYNLASKRTRLYSGTTSRDRLNADGALLGSLISPGFKARRCQVAGPWYVSAVGDLPASKTQVDASTPSTVYRRRYRAYVSWFGVATAAAESTFLKATVDAELHTFSGTTWATNTVTPTERGASLVAPALVVDGRARRGNITGTSLYNPRAHFDSYYFWSMGDVLAGLSGLRLIEVTFEEATAQEAVVARLLELNFTFTDDLGGVLDDSVIVGFPGAVVMVDEGF